MKRVISGQTVREAFEAGHRRLAAPRGEAIVTPEAWTQSHLLGVTLDQDPDGSDEPGRCERVVDPSGAVLVRGDTVRLGPFAGAGPGRNVRLADLITGGDGSPMTAGIMSWGREDNFPWSLDYDEVDLVLEGVLRIELGGRTLEGKAGDVFYLPKGSRVVFATPNRTRVFYVTYPANWASAAQAPARPQK